MPLTNWLARITTEQAAWAIKNGTAWIAYLQANGRDVYQSPATTSATNTEVTPAEAYKAICDTLENIWLALLKESGGETLEPEQIPDWVDTLQSVVAVIPAGYERQHDIMLGTTSLVVVFLSLRLLPY